MTEFTLADLMPRFDGWEVMSVVNYGEMTEIRVGNSFLSSPDWLLARGAVFVAATPGELGEETVVGAPLEVSEDRLGAGPWQIDNEKLVAGQMLESAILLVPEASTDPVAEPSTTADLILQSGSMVWPTVADLPEELRGLELLDAVTRLALIQPSLVTSVVVESGNAPTRAWDTFVTPFGVLETERHPEVSEPMAVSYFPLSDLPARLWERSGVARLIGPGASSPNASTVSVRSTFMDENGLVAGALAWEEAGTGELTTEDGQIAPLSLASELLRMLPGGDIDFEPAGKGVVGEV